MRPGHAIPTGTCIQRACWMQVFPEPIFSSPPARSRSSGRGDDVVRGLPRRAVRRRPAAAC
eukprot:5435817-Prymnesium_polylepis.1